MYACIQAYNNNLINDKEIIKMPIELESPRLIKNIVYSELKVRIIQGKYKPGERLIEQKLSNYFQISRTPLREAIQKLETEGLVTKVKSGGVQVSRLSEEEIREIYDVRIIIEKRVVEYACNKSSEKHLNDLKKVIDQERKRMEEKQHNILNALDQSDKFHLTLFKIYGNKKLFKIYEESKSNTQRYAYLALKSEKRYKNSCLEHIKLFNLIKEKKTKEAMKFIEEHILNAKKATIKQLKKRKYLI